MANVSEAQGTIEVVAPSESVIKAIEKVFDLALKGTYDTNLDCKTYCNIDGKYFLNADFWGSGRWGYEENIQKLFTWHKNQMSKKDIELLESSDFTIIFDFIDYEPGFEVFYSATEYLEHKAGTSLEDTVYDISDYEDLDCSWGNRIRMGVESKESLEGFAEFLSPKELFKFFNNEKEGLEKLYKMPLNDIMETVFPSLKENYLEGAKNQ